jgi:hypothetical protein
MIPNCFKNEQFTAVENRIYNVTPEMAKELLELNIANNRKPSQFNLYANDMRKKLWVETGEVLKFSRDGQLLDGQNRLKAIIASGVTQKLEFRFNLERACLDFLDSGKLKSLRDRMAQKLIPNVKYTAPVSNRLFAIFEKKQNVSSTQGGQTPAVRTDNRNSRNSFSHHDVIEYYYRHKKVIESIVTPYLAKSVGNIKGTDIMVAAYILQLFGENQRIEFLKLLTSGANLSQDSPILYLRTFLIGNNKQKTIDGNFILNSVDCFNRVLICYDIWRSGIKAKTVPSNDQKLTLQEIISMLSKKYTGKLI